MVSSTPATAGKTTSLSRRAQIVLKLAMALFSPLFLLGLLEITGYVWEKNQAESLYAWELVASRRIDFIYIATPSPGYTLMSPGSHYRWQGIPVEINARGLRGPESEYTKHDRVFRILNLGDSVVMGWGIRAEDTYGRQLQHMLNQQAGNPGRFEVINAGVPGWNLENVLAYLQAEGLKYTPDLILLDITIANDINGRNAISRRRSPVRDLLMDKTHFWPFLTLQYNWLKARAAGDARIDLIDPPSSPEKYFPVDPDAERWQRMRDWINRISEIARAHDIPLIMVLFPLEYQVIDPDFSTLPQAKLSEIALEQGISVVDLLPAFQRACQEKASGACQVHDRYLFADVWMHPSPLGSKIAAAEIQAALGGWFPELLVEEKAP
jgi:hypothetical protein